MRFVGFLGVGVALALAGMSALLSTSSLAFDEQGGAAVEQSAPASGSIKSPSAEFSAPTPRSDSAGTEVRIPGLGKLGVLPKMDFGLELLYGASDGKAQPELESAPTDDLTVRGSVKHNF